MDEDSKIKLNKIKLKVLKGETPTDKEIDDFRFSKAGRQQREASFMFSDIGKLHFARQLIQIENRINTTKNKEKKEDG